MDIGNNKIWKTGGTANASPSLQEKNRKHILWENLFNFKASYNCIINRILFVAFIVLSLQI